MDKYALISTFLHHQVCHCPNKVEMTGPVSIFIWIGSGLEEKLSRKHFVNLSPCTSTLLSFQKDPIMGINWWPFLTIYKES